MLYVNQLEYPHLKYNHNMATEAQDTRYYLFSRK